MAVLLCHAFPALRIYNPTSGEIVSFFGGKLEIEADDPNYEVVMAEASRNPSIVVVESIGTCPYCGETFTGGNAKLLLAQHTKNDHFEKWLEAKDVEDNAVRNVEIKAREGFACDVCAPAQVFGTEDDLALHVLAFHASAPEINDAGEATDAPTRKRRRPGEVENG